MTVSFGGKSWPISTADMNLGSSSDQNGICVGGIFDIVCLISSLCTCTCAHFCPRELPALEEVEVNPTGFLAIRSWFVYFPFYLGIYRLSKLT